MNPWKINLIIMHVPSLHKSNSLKIKTNSATWLAPKMLGRCFPQCGQKAEPRFQMQLLHCFARVPFHVKACPYRFKPFRPMYNSHAVGSIHGWTSVEKGRSNLCLKSKSSICNFRHIFLSYTTEYGVPMKFSSLYQNEDFVLHFLSAEKL